MGLQHPEYQEHANPLKWGWYYIERNGPNTGLMTKGAAKKMLRKDGTISGGYGQRLAKHPNAPRSILRRVTFPLHSIGKSANPG